MEVSQFSPGEDEIPREACAGANSRGNSIFSVARLGPIVGQTFDRLNLLAFGLHCQESDVLLSEA